MSTDSEMAQVLAQLSVLSEVSAPSYEPSVHGGTPDRSPKGPRESTFDVFRRKYAAARGDVTRSAVLEEAIQALRSARHARRGLLVPGTDEWRVAIANDPRTPEDVSHAYGCARSYVYELKKQKRYLKTAA